MSLLTSCCCAIASLSPARCALLCAQRRDLSKGVSGAFFPSEAPSPVDSELPVFSTSSMLLVCDLADLDSSLGQIEPAWAPVIEPQASTRSTSPSRVSIRLILIIVLAVAAIDLFILFVFDACILITCYPLVIRAALSTLLLLSRSLLCTSGPPSAVWVRASGVLKLVWQLQVDRVAHIYVQISYCPIRWVWCQTFSTHIRVNYFQRQTFSLSCFDGQLSHSIVRVSLWVLRRAHMRYCFGWFTIMLHIANLELHACSNYLAPAYYYA